MRDLTRETITLATARGEKATVLLSHMHLLFTLPELGDFEGMLRSIQTIEALGTELRDPRLGWWLPLFRATHAHLCGYFADGQRELDRVRT